MAGFTYANESSVSLNTESKDPVVSLQADAGPKFDVNHAEDMSQKYHVGLGQASPGVPAIQTAITTNSQARLDELFRQDQEVKLAEQRNALLQQIANTAQGSPTPDDLAVITSLSQEDLVSPKFQSIVEEAYAKRFTNDALARANDSSGVYDEAIVSAAHGTDQLLDVAEWQTAQNVIANNILQDLDHRFNNAGLLAQGWAWAQTFAPFRSWIGTNTMIEKPEYLRDILPGDSIEESVSYLRTLPPAEFKRVLEEGVQRALQWGDYLDAMSFVSAVLAFGNSDKNWANVTAGIDIASVLPLGSLAKVLKGSARAATVPFREAETMASVAGHLDDAAHIATVDALKNGTLPIKNINKIQDVERNFLSIARPQEFFTGLKAKAPAAVISRLSIAASSRASKALEFISDINKVDRGFEEIAWVDTIARAREIFNHQNHHIVDIVRNVPDNTTNVSSVTVKMGKVDGSWFANENTAKGFAARVIKAITPDYKVVEQPTGGWAIEITKNVDETKGSIRDLTIGENRTPDNLLTRFLSFGLGADVKLSKSQTAARGVAVMGVERSHAALSEFAKPMAVLYKNKKAFKEFEDFLIKSRDHVDPNRGAGVTYHTLQEFEDAWFDTFGKGPSLAQVDAYNAFKQFYDLDWVVRNLDVYKQKAILGIEKFTFEFDTGGRGVEKFMPVSFEGKEIDVLPRGKKESFRVAFIDEHGVLVKKQHSISLKNDQNWEALEQRIKDGAFKIIQAADPLKIGDDYFEYVAMKGFQRERPSFDLNYREGSRVIQAHPWYIKWPKMLRKNGTDRYLGDLAVANARSQEEGQFILNTMNTVRKMVLNPRIARVDVKKYFEEHLPMWNWSDFQKAVNANDMDPSIPMVLTHAGSRTVDSVNVPELLRKEGVATGVFETGDEYRLSDQIRGRFLGERDDTRMKAWGVEKGSIFELRTDSQLSPLDTMRISMSDLVDVNVMNDYKIKSVRDYTSTFGDVLEGTPEDFLTNGLSFIYAPKYLKGADPNRIKTAEGVRKTILSLWEHNTFVDKQVSLYKEKIVRAVRNVFGENVAEWVDDKVIPKIRNADTYMRAFAFHTKMGFNPKQLFLQMSSAVNIVSISPKQGIRGAMLSMPLMAGIHADESMLAHLGARFSKVTGIPSKDYAELVRLFKKSGFGLVKGDISYIDDLRPPQIIQGPVNKILQLGGSFFRGGERTARSMAYAAAYLERKAGKKVLDRSDEAWILQRAKDLTGNMTRDSNAPYQKGYVAVATQFFGYQMRLMEQMLGSKLTGAEKARLFLGISAMYGVPVGMGMTFGVVPVREWIKDWIAADGGNTDGTLAEPFIDGFASQFLKLLTGTDFNVSERYGPGGLTTFYDMWKKDATWNDLLLGASGGIIGDTLKDADPLIKGFFATIDFNDLTTFPVTTDDLVKPLRDISVVNSSIKLWQAISLGKFISKNENVLTDVSVLEGAIAFALGVDPQRVADAFSGLDALQARNEMQKAARKDMISDYRLGLQALRSGNQELAAVYFGRVKARGATADFTFEDMNQIYKQALDEEPLDESIASEMAKIIESRTR